MLAVQTWRQLRFVAFALCVVICLCLGSTVYIVPSFLARSSYSFSPRFRTSLGSDGHSSPGHAVNGSHFPLSLQSSNEGHDDALGVFSQIFVISRATRLDRRAAMEQLRRTLALNWTYVDAMSPEDAFVARVSERVRLLRQRNDACFFQWPPDLAGTASSTSTISLMDKTSSSILSVHCVTPVSAGSLAVTTTVGFGFNDYLTPKESLSKTPKPRLHRSSNTASSAFVPLTCAVANRIHGVEFHPSLPTHMMLTPSKIACWSSHMSAIAQFATGHAHDLQRAGLFLEDDIDMERDIRRSVELVWSFLPPEWDIVFLGKLSLVSLRHGTYGYVHVGHCWSNESHYPALSKVSQGSSLEITLHPSFAPKCTHAYALSQSGAHRLLQYLLYPPFSYSRALDQALSWLIESDRLKAFSLVPSIVVQRKVDRSDIDGGEHGLGSRWKDHLKHGILDI